MVTSEAPRVVIVLPFPVPSRPNQTTTMKVFKKRSNSPFHSHSRVSIRDIQNLGDFQQKKTIRIASWTKTAENREAKSVTLCMFCCFAVGVGNAAGELGEREDSRWQYVSYWQESFGFLPQLLYYGSRGPTQKDMQPSFPSFSTLKSFASCTRDFSPPALPLPLCPFRMMRTHPGSWERKADNIFSS